MDPPVGEATTAQKQGQGFFEFSFKWDHLSETARSSWATIFAIPNKKTQTHAGTLADIEPAGWLLGHVGHVFVVPVRAVETSPWPKGSRPR